MATAGIDALAASVAGGEEEEAAAAAAAAAEQPSAGDALGDRLAALSFKDLRAEASRRGLSVQGRRLELEQRLMQSYAAEAEAAADLADESAPAGSVRPPPARGGARCPCCGCRPGG